ncbi:TRAP transporter large permease [Aminiphilus sp.]|jgi:C4-dicarboxylate transporter DctM subunit|uniref:TRAP transporter large permease n=1 Tax=Aminiphilus sp. TaxID=1872488 RepID=UPI002634BAF5|nr:TRAP transporter large permease [Aminiphilus sp.]
MIIGALVLLFVTLVVGIPVPFAFLASSVYVIVLGGYDPSFLLPYGYSKMSTIVLLAIPLFIMAGGIMERGNIGEKLIDVVDLFVGRIRGGLGAVAVVSCAVFGSITGSCCATLSCIGSIMFPRLEKAGYSKGYAAALLANASVLGILIPPSAIMILYSWVGGQSVLACFLATVIPGVILTVLFAAINMWMQRKNPDLVLAEPFAPGEFSALVRKRTTRALPALFLPVLVLGGIYGGFMTPTEAAALATVYAVPVGFFIYKGLNGREFLKVLVESATTTGVIMVMLYSVMILSRLYIMEDLPGELLALLQSVTSSKVGILLMVNVFMVVMGMLMDDVSAVMLCTPILLPVVTAIGVHPIHFAAILGVNLGMGNITPPTAPVLYLSGRLNGAAVNGMLYPTLVLICFGWLPVLLLTTFFPDLSLLLPRMILGIR